MKKRLAMIMIGMIVLLMTGCSQKDTELTGKTDPMTENEDSQMKASIEITSESKQETAAKAVRESNSNPEATNMATLSVEAAGDKIERTTEAAATEHTSISTTTAADGAPVTMTENKITSTTEAATERKTEATTAATGRSTTQSITESTTEAATTEAAHTHTWKAVYKTVKHEEVGHWEQVEVAPAFQNPIEEGHSICSNPGCGYDYTAHGQHGTDYHQCADGTVGSNYHNEQVIVGYETVPAIIDDVWVVDQKAYTEQVVYYYECNECGARK